MTSAYRSKGRYSLYQLLDPLPQGGIVACKLPPFPDSPVVEQHKMHLHTGVDMASLQFQSINDTAGWLGRCAQIQLTTFKILLAYSIGQLTAIHRGTVVIIAGVDRRCGRAYVEIGICISQNPDGALWRSMEWLPGLAFRREQLNDRGGTYANENDQQDPER